MFVQNSDPIVLGIIVTLGLLLAFTFVGSQLKILSISVL